MKPLHSEITRINKCPCCHSKYSRNSVRQTNIGKSSARQAAKSAISKELI